MWLEAKRGWCWNRRQSHPFSVDQKLKCKKTMIPTWNTSCFRSLLGLIEVCVCLCWDLFACLCLSDDHSEDVCRSDDHWEDTECEDPPLQVSWHFLDLFSSILQSFTARCVSQQSFLWRFEQRHALSGMCFRGSTCTFAHSEAELREVPDLQGTEPCFYFAEGRCCKGYRCNFSHGQQKFRTKQVLARARVKETFAANQKVLEKTSENFEMLRLQSLQVAQAAQALQGTVCELEMLQVSLMMHQTAFDIGLPLQDGIQNSIQQGPHGLPGGPAGLPPGLPPPSVGDSGYPSAGQSSASWPSSEPARILIG